MPPALPASLRSATPALAGLHSLRGTTMGTTWCVKFAATAPPLFELQQAIRQALDRVVAEMSSWEANSDLCRYNTAAPGSWTSLPRDFGTVLACALEVASETDGAFDPTVGALVDLWGFGPAGVRPGPPGRAAIELARMTVGWQRLRFDAASRRVLQPGGVRLDLSGIAKGYAVDRVALWLEALGVTNYLVEIGGELRGRGRKPDGLPWWVGLEAPPGEGDTDEDGEPIVVALHALSVATSGSYRRYFDRDGRRFHHTLDPRTGEPVVDAPVAVTVLHADCMRADALATALTVLGVERGFAHACRHDIAALFRWCSPHGQEERWTPALAAFRE